MYQKGNEAHHERENEMNTETAQKIADMANAAEAAILDTLNKENPEMRDWYMAQPRETRVEIAMNAARAAAKNLAA